MWKAQTGYVVSPVSLARHQTTAEESRPRASKQVPSLARNCGGKTDEPLRANDMVNRQPRSTTGCYKSANTGALVAEAGLRPATSLLGNSQRRFPARTKPAAHLDSS